MYAGYVAPGGTLKFVSGHEEAVVKNAPLDFFHGFDYYVKNRFFKRPF